MKTILSDGLSCRFKNMALLCAVLVIMIHCVSAFGVRFSYVDRIARDGICRIAVPFFFFASGFFLAGHCQEEGWWKRALKSRVKTLVIPFLVMVTLYWIWCLLMAALGNLSHGRPFWDHYFINCLKDNVFVRYGLHPLQYPILVPFWYIRALLILVLLSPLYLPLCKTRWWPVFCFVLCGILGPWEELEGGCSVYYFFRKFLAVQGLFYLSLGAAFRLGTLNVLWCNKKIVYGLLMGGGLMGAKVLFQINGHNMLAAYSGWLAVPLLMIGVFNVISERRSPGWVASCSFPLYAVHYFVLCAIPSGVVEGIRARGFALWLPMTLGVIVITFGIVVIQRRWFSSLNRYLYGGR